MPCKLFAGTSPYARVGQNTNTVGTPPEGSQAQKPSSSFWARLSPYLSSQQNNQVCCSVFCLQKACTDFDTTHGRISTSVLHFSGPQVAKELNPFKELRFKASERLFRLVFLSTFHAKTTEQFWFTGLFWYGVFQKPLNKAFWRCFSRCLNTFSKRSAREDISTVLSLHPDRDEVRQKRLFVLFSSKLQLTRNTQWH